MSKLKILGALAALTVLASLAAEGAGTATAARGGGGKPGGGGSATLSVSPSPVPAGTTTIVITGSGFAAGQEMMVGPRGVIPTVTVRADSSGAFTLSYSPWDGGFDTPGLYYVDARSTSRKGTLLATTTFTVE